MTLDEAIQQLQNLREEAKRGDMPMACLTDVDGVFAIELERKFDLIELPCEGCNCDSVCEKAQLVCAYLEEPDPDQVHFPRLRLI